MATVRLPMFHDNGQQMKCYLEVDVEYFVPLEPAFAAGHFRVIDPDRMTPEEEIENVDRIISGLPTRNFEPFEISEKHDVLLSPSRSVDFQIRETLDRKARDLDSITWRTIDGYEGYRMNRNRMIIDKDTDKTVRQENRGNGAGMKVMLFDSTKARLVYVDVDFLFKKTFPDLA